jgi:hypothetical protein
VFVLLQRLLGSEGAVATVAGELFLARFQHKGGKATPPEDIGVTAGGALGALGQGVVFEVEGAMVEGEQGGEAGLG